MIVITTSGISVVKYDTDTPQQLIRSGHDGDHTVFDVMISCEIYTPYAGAAGILLHINGELTMGKLKVYILS